MAAFRYIVLTVLLISAVIHSSTGYKEDEIKTILSAIPKADFGETLRYYLSQGARLKRMQYTPYLATVTPSPKQLEDLFEYFLENHQVEDVPPSLRSVICFPEGCIDMGDPGNHP